MFIRCWVAKICNSKVPQKHKQGVARNQWFFPYLVRFHSIRQKLYWTIQIGLLSNVCSCIPSKIIYNAILMFNSFLKVQKLWMEEKIKIIPSSAMKIRMAPCEVSTEIRTSQKRTKNEVVKEAPGKQNTSTDTTNEKINSLLQCTFTTVHIKRGHKWQGRRYFQR